MPNKGYIRFEYVQIGVLPLIKKMHTENQWNLMA